MSIIEQALKKATGKSLKPPIPEVKKEEVKQPQDFTPQVVDRDTDRLKLNRRRVLGLCVLSALALGSLVFFRGPAQRIVEIENIPALNPLSQVAVEKSIVKPIEPVEAPKPVVPAEPIEPVEVLPPKPATEMLKPAPTLDLSGIVYSEEDSYCIINGKVAREGDWVADKAELLKIYPHRVEVKTPTEIVSLKIGKR